jgi:paraquat-inducible protein A
MSQITAKTLAPKNYHACHACDLLVYNTDVSPGEKAICPRCGSSLYQTKENTVNNTLALVITGLFLLYPAISLPIMEMTIIGDMSFNTLLNAVIEIYKSGYYWIAFMVLFTSILTPAAKLVVLLHIKFKRHTKLLPLLFRYYVKLDVWEMLDVYMIAMLVSVIKLFDIAAIKGGWGLYCFVGLLLISILVTVKLDKKQIWECIEDLCKKKNN